MKQAAVFLCFLLLATPVVAQAPDPGQIEHAVTDAALDFELSIQGSSTASVEQFPGQASVTVRIEDHSRDGAGLATGSDGAGQFHYYRFSVTSLANDPGWRVIPPGEIFLTAGGSADVDIKFEATPTAKLPFYPIVLNVTARTQFCCGEVESSIPMQGYATGLSTVSAFAKKLQIEAAPEEQVAFEIDVTNNGLDDRAYDFIVQNNPCGLLVGQTGGFVPALQTDTFVISAEAPRDRIWYASENCALSVLVQEVGGTGSVTVPLSLKVNGLFVDPAWIFTFVYIAIPFTLFILFLAWRKRRIEEEILGKPQKPWTIPAEQIYLAELQEKDPRAAYVVRNFLMEDEYRSSLDWYHAYKAATKGERSKERLILKQEHKLERYERKRTRVLARPEKKADKFALKLQKKLDRKDRKAHRKEMRKWRKSCKKMDAKNQKVHEKLHGVWEKQKKRAEKKGLEVPPEPVLAEPDYPEEPVRYETPLAEHRWARKAIRYQDRMGRREARLQAKYDKGHAKHLAKARKKAQKIARKLDDPDFINEHALLKGADSE